MNKVACLTAILFLLMYTVGCGQQQQSPEMNAGKMNANEYASWVKTNRLASEKDAKIAEAFRTTLVERFQEDRSTYDQTVMEVVNASNFAEGQMDPKCPVTLQLVDQLLNFTDSRRLLKADLLKKKAYLQGLGGDAQAVLATRQSSFETLQQLHLDIDRQRIENMTLLGHGYFAQGKTKEAEAMYLDVMSYPWHLVSDSASFAFLRDQYIESAKGLIRCRRGNLQALQNIFFVPATHSILKPLLEKAIQEAGQ